MHHPHWLRAERRSFHRLYVYQRCQGVGTDRRPSGGCNDQHDAFPPNVLLVRGTAAIGNLDVIPDEYPETNRKRTSEDEPMQWETEVRRLYKKMARSQTIPM